jgi:hypothetical protein
MVSPSGAQSGSSADLKGRFYPRLPFLYKGADCYRVGAAFRFKGNVSVAVSQVVLTLVPNHAAVILGVVNIDADVFGSPQSGESCWLPVGHFVSLQCVSQ